MQRVFAPKSVSSDVKAVEALPVPQPPTASEVTHFSCKIEWSAITVKSGKVKYIIEEAKGTDGSEIQVYAGYSLETKVDDMECLKQYKYRLRIELADVSALSEWISVTTDKEPAGVLHLNKAIKRDDAVKVRTMLMTEKNLDLNTMDEKGFTPLMTAAVYNAMESLDCLIEYDPDLDLQNPSGKTALMLACQSGHVEATIRLLDEGAELSAGEGASSPLHWAVDSNSVNIVKRLIEYDCDVNHVDETTTWTPMFRLASVTGNAEVGAELIRNGADVNIPDSEGKNALMQATINNHHALVKILLEAGAKPDKKNNLGRSARDMALAFDKLLVVQHFKNY